MLRLLREAIKMSCCNNNIKKETPKKKCPLCNQEGEYIHYSVLKNVVKTDLKDFVEYQNYFTCINSDCEVVFYSEDEGQCWLVQDIDLSADFDAVTKIKKQDCSSCSGGCHKKRE